jgi:hypothetical protein
MDELKKVLSDEEMLLVFCNLEQIIEFSNELKKGLEKVLAMPPEEQMIGGLFLEKVFIFMPTLLFAFSCPNPNNLIPSDATIPRVH